MTIVMNEDKRFPIQVPALRVTQPLGEFFVVSLKAKDLLKVTYSDILRVEREDPLAGGYTTSGTQRESKDKRMKDIAMYIGTVEASFPNSIILAANYREDGTLEDNDEFRWKLAEGENGCFSLVIPTEEKLASIVDGQHRLLAFKHIDVEPERRNMELLCSVYLDLPRPYQMYIFATINTTQVKVDKSLSYELYGADLGNEEPDTWHPEKLAVYLCRRLNTNSGSPFYKHIIVAAQDDDILRRTEKVEVGWRVSTATVVEGILKLISTNPKEDRDLLHRKPLSSRKRSSLPNNKAPFRTLYKVINDLAIYTAVENYFKAVEETLWEVAQEDSYLFKTVGVQALFDVLNRILAERFEEDRDIRIDYFAAFLRPFCPAVASKTFINQASGIGRVRIRYIILLFAKLISVDELPKTDKEEYLQIAREHGTFEDGYFVPNKDNQLEG